MILLWLISSVLFLFIILSWLRTVKHRWVTNVGGPFPIPIFGNAHLFIVKSTEFLSLLKRLSQKYGDAYLVYYITHPHLVMSHPKYLEPVLSSRELITKGGSYAFLRPWLGNGLLTATGQRWQTHRKFLTPAFHFNILQNFLPVFCKNGRILADKLEQIADGRSINLFPIIALAALDNVTEAIMGISVDSQKNVNSEYVKAIEILSQIVSLRMQIPLYGEDFVFNWTSYKKQQDDSIKFLHMHTRNVIEARRRDLQEMNITSLKESNDLGIKNKHAFLDLLLLADVEGKKIDEEHVREEVDTFMFEGHDTTTSGIVFCIYCLSKYPDIQEKVYEEQKGLFANNLLLDPTYTELQQMKYLEMVIKETLRLYPSVPLIERMVMKDIDIGDLRLKRGTSLTMNIHQMQRHPGLYEAPLEFRPERFEAGSQETKNPFAYLAFSAGPRNCIGQKFAMMEMKVTVAEIVKRFKILPVKQEPKLCADLILRSTNGVHIQLLSRKDL